MKFQSKKYAHHKKTEHEIKVSKKLLQSVINAPNVGLAVYKAVRNENGKIINFIHEFVNERTKQTLGKDPTGWLLTDHGKEGIEQLPSFINVVETGKPDNYVRHTFIGENEFWFMFSNAKLDNERMVHMWEDITQIKTAEREIIRLKDEATNKASDRYKALFNSIDEGFCIVEIELNKNGKIRNIYFKEVNDAFEQQSGFSNVVGKSVKELLPHFEKFWIDTFTEVMRTGRSVRAENYVQDVNRWFSAYFSLVGNIGSKYIAVVFNDITERKLAEQRKDDFMNMVSHELKTPLTCAKILGQLLEREFVAIPKAVNMISKMNRQIDRLSELVGELLDATRLEQGKLQLKDEVFLVKDAIREIAEDLQLVTKHNLIIKWKTKLLVQGDKERIRQILTNLIMNAVKYSPEGTDIILSSKQTDEFLVISVQDFGIGIPQDELEHVFDRFYQITQNKRNTYPGMGMGLYIVKELLSRMRGNIWVESTDGKGSTFYFTLPLYRE